MASTGTISPIYNCNLTTVGFPEKKNDRQQSTLLLIACHVDCMDSKKEAGPGVKIEEYDWLKSKSLIEKAPQL